MKTKSHIISRDLYFYYAFLIAGVVLIFSMTKAESFLWINNSHNRFLDFFMPPVTFLGDGIFAVIISILMILYKIRYSIFLFLSYLLSGLFVQLLKRLIFSDFLRPVAYFRELGIEIYTLPGIEIPNHYSFPSGHTATAFALYLGISFFVRSWYWKLALLILAMIAGFSRIYLAMHFPVDVIAGSLIGVLVTFILFNWISGWKKDWLDVSLPSIIFKQAKK